jgi:hypothetical protein
MRGKTPDLSDTGGEIGNFLSADQLDVLSTKLGITGKELSNMSARLNQEIHYLVKGLKLLKVKRTAIRSNRNLDYQNDIENAAAQLCERIRKAPIEVSNNRKFRALVGRLERISELFSQIRKDPGLSEFGLEDTYGGKRSDLRIKFVRDAHDIYKHFTGQKDWITFSHHTNDPYPNTFFQLVRLAYKCPGAGLPRSNSTIRDDIKGAKRE